MEEHLTKVDADIVGMTEMDAFAGDCAEANVATVKMMQKIGYDYQYQEKSSHLMGMGIFYKKDKFNLCEIKYSAFAVGATQGYMQCLFAFKSNPAIQFVFVETHLKAKPVNMPERTNACKIMIEDFSKNFQDKPVFIAGDFNEEAENEPITIMNSLFEDLYSRTG